MRRTERAYGILTSMKVLRRLSLPWVGLILVASAIASFAHQSALAQSQNAELNQRCASAILISFDDAQKLATEKGRAELPPLAKQVGLKGVVRVETCVSEAGLVILTKPAGGPPILIPSAIESVKNWKFRPFLQGGTPAPFRTVIEVSYLQGSSPAEVNREQEDNQRYFAAENSCRGDLKSKDLKQADLDCKNAFELVEKLPPERSMERQTASGLLGQTYFAERKFPDALPFYEKELEISKAHQKPDEAELAYAYHHAGLTLHALGLVEEATKDYSLAETVLTAAREHIQSDFLKAQYTKTLANIRSNFLILLQQSGQDKRAEELKTRITNEPR